MNRNILRSERYGAIILASIGLSLLSIMIFCNTPKMFTRGSIYTAQWHIGEIIKPLIVIFGFMFVATKYFSLQNRNLKGELSRLRPKYYAILKGTFRKNLPSVNDARWELASKIERCIRWPVKLRLYEDLYDLCLLQGVSQFERDPQIPSEMTKWLTERGYPDKRRLDAFEDRIMELIRNDVNFFGFLMNLFKEGRFMEPKGRILCGAISHEFYQVDDIPFYLERFKGEDIGRKGMVGVFASILVFSLFLGVGIIERILPWSLIGIKNRFRS